MREADSLAIELDDTRVERGNESRGTLDTGRSLRDRDRRMRMGCRREQEVAALDGQRTHSPCTRSCSDSGSGIG